MHRLGSDGLRDLIPTVGRYVSERLLLGGLAIVENRLDQTMLVEALGPEDVGGPREAALLEAAAAELPRIPFADLDVIVVERVGKDVSGTALDPNVVGRWLVMGLPEPQPPLTRSIVALDLTPASHGNALGIGLVDFVPRRLADGIDLAKMYVNGLTAGWLGFARCKLPIVLPTDRDAIATAAAVCERAPGDPRLVWIRDTLETQDAGHQQGAVGRGGGRRGAGAGERALRVQLRRGRAAGAAGGAGPARAQRVRRPISVSRWWFAASSANVARPRPLAPA